MADSIFAQITTDIKTAVNDVLTFGGTTTASLERLYLNINGRYPFIEILGPYGVIEGETHDTMDTILQYAFKYYVDYNDESFTDDSELSKVTENVARDLIKALMVDQTRGGLAENTEISGYGLAVEEIDNNTEYFIYVIIDVQTLVNSDNPYELA